MGILSHAQDVVFPSLASFAQDLSYAAQRRVASCFLFPPYLKGPIAGDVRQQTYFQYAWPRERDFICPHLWGRLLVTPDSKPIFNLQDRTRDFSSQGVEAISVVCQECEHTRAPTCYCHDLPCSYLSNTWDDTHLGSVFERQKCRCRCPF